MHGRPSPDVAIQSVLARIRRLGERRTRDEQRCFWIEGVRAFVQACDAHFHFDTIVFSRLLLKHDLSQMLVRRLAARGVRRVRISPEQFRSISVAERASGIGAIVQQRWTPLDRAAVPAAGLWVILEQIRSPGNLGSIVRTAEACGAAGVVLLGPLCDPFDLGVVRASMGGIFHVPLVRTSHAEVRDWAALHGTRLVGLSPRGEHPWTSQAGAERIGLVVGEERAGLSNELQTLCDVTVRLPMRGRADSLNVSVAAGVMMYEVVRHWAPA